MCAVNLREALARRAYDFLDVGKSPRRADCIFVLSGKQERKKYGIKMWRFGYAPQLILSVGKEECGGFGELQLESDGGLSMAAAQAEDRRSRFFVRLDRQETFCKLVSKSEAKALADYVKDLSIRSLLVVSSPVHMRRTARSFRWAFRKSGIQLTFVPVPEEPTPAEIWSELRKYLFFF